MRDPSLLWHVLFLAVVFVAVFCAGAILVKNLPEMMAKRFKARLVLTPQSPTYDKWLESPVPIDLRIYFFNVTNPSSVLQGQKPALLEVGPYTFKEFRKKIVTGWDSEAGTVHYINEKSYFFDGENSVGDQEDLVTTVNLPLLYFSKMISPLNVISRTLFSSLINRYGDTFFITRPVRELLFEGYPIKILEENSKFLEAVLGTGNSKARFGFFYGKNGSREEEFSVYTGARGAANFTRVASYRNQTTLPYWRSRYCNMLNGTDAKQFPFPLESSEKIYIFSSDLCRSLYLEPEKQVEVKGIEVQRYVGPKSLFDRSPENDCFCTDPKHCPPSGILQMSHCKKGAPIALSAPHFYNADPVFLSRVDGLNPNKSLHETYLDIDSRTGMTLRARQRVMISVETAPDKKILELRAAPTLVFPVLWTEQAATISGQLAEQYIFKTVGLPRLVFSLSIASLFIGLLGMAIMGALAIRNDISNAMRHNAFFAPSTDKNPANKLREPDVISLAVCNPKTS